MKDITIRPIQPVQEPRSSDKAQPTQQPTGADFGKELQSVSAQLEQAQGAAALQSNSKAVDENFSRQHEVFEKLMESRQSLAKLYQAIIAHRNETQDED